MLCGTSYFLVRWTPPLNPLEKTPFPLPPAKICALITYSSTSTRRNHIKTFNEMMIHVCMSHENIILCFWEIENNFLSARRKTMHENMIVIPKVFQGNYKESCHSSTLPSKCSANLKTIKVSETSCFLLPLSKKSSQLICCLFTLYPPKVLLF